MARHIWAPGTSVAVLGLLAISSLSAFSLPARNVPDSVGVATDLGRVEAGSEMNLTVVLKMHNQSEFDKVVEDLYDPASSTYGQWLTDQDFEKYAPTAAEFETVKSELVKQGFSVLSSDPQRFTIRVHGTANVVERAFQTELHTFANNGRTFQAHTREAQLTGQAGALVESVSGLERYQSRPKLSTVRNPRTGKQMVRKVTKTAADQASFLSSLTDAPLTTATTYSFGSSLPTAKYTGLQYTADGKIAAFTPKQLEAHYGLTSLIHSGFDGRGQTIALVEGYGYPDAQKDANAAASLFGLPQLTSKNFSIIYPEGKPVNPNAGVLLGWDVETALDIQSSHATAPGAKIIVVASSGQDNEDQIASLNYVISHKLANTVSNSWENDSEIIAGALEEQAFNSVLQRGAAAGISFQFSSGDGGDQGLGTPTGAVSLPSNSPYATAVGGTSVLNNPYGKGQIVTGWGNNLVFLYNDGVEDPLIGEFFGGAGGGQSRYFKKPSWQKALPGTWRQVPDVAALADPYTGFPILITQSSQQTGQVWGGTSLACPIFTAVWAIADQYNGKALGQAAPIVSRLKTGEILDVTTPPTSVSKHDVAGSIVDSGGTTTFTATTLFTDADDINNPGSGLSLYSQTRFLSAIWPDLPGMTGLYLAVSFGTDSSLTVTSGWDNVTGWGEPNGLPFIQGVTGKTHGASLK